MTCVIPILGCKWEGNGLLSKWACSGCGHMGCGECSGVLEADGWCMADQVGGSRLLGSAVVLG